MRRVWATFQVWTNFSEDEFMLFPALENLIHQLSSLPGIGQRSAMRIAFHLIKLEEYKVRNLTDAVLELKSSVRFCSSCGGLSENEICSFCADKNRNRSLLCVVEEPQDIYAIEKTGEFTGLYHVLMGAISPLDGIGPEDLRIEELKDRLEMGPLEEIFLATNPTLEGDATAGYIHDLCSGMNIKITRISHGLQTGGAIEYADRASLARSIRNRQTII